MWGSLTMPDSDCDEQDVANTLQVEDETLDDAEARAIARQCLELANGAGLSNAKDECQSKPIFASGADVPESTAHDISALLSVNPAWVSLEYEPSGNKSTSWKTAPCASLPGAPTSPGSGLACDEYPFLASTSGGGTAAPTPDLKWISTGDNSLQGSRYSSFLANCSMYSKIDKSFLGIPIPPALGIPTQTRLCGSD